MPLHEGESKSTPSVREQVEARLGAAITSRHSRPNERVNEAQLSRDRQPSADLNPPGVSGDSIL